MIKPKCSKCGSELHQPGGLAFGPPTSNRDASQPDSVPKYHICLTCWSDMLAWLTGQPAPRFWVRRCVESSHTAVVAEDKKAELTRTCGCEVCSYMLVEQVTPNEP